MRKRLFELHQVPMDAPLLRHKILVLEKSWEIAPVLQPQLCSDVTAWAAELPAYGASVECISPKGFSVKEQLEAVSGASVIVAEMGSTAYLTLFQRPGASIVMLKTMGDLKEAQVMLYMDVQAWYIDPALLKPGESVGTLQLALERAGQRLGIEKAGS